MRSMLDFLYCLGCGCDLNDTDTQALCRAFGVDFDELQNHCGPNS